MVWPILAGALRVMQGSCESSAFKVASKRGEIREPIGEPHVLRICDGRVLQGSEAGGLAEFPLVGKPGVEISARAKQEVSTCNCA